MDSRIRDRILIPLLLLAAPAIATAQGADSLPSGVTKDMVSRGKVLFGGAGLCLACHGPDAKGGVGPNLTDQQWLHDDGNYEALVKLITTGVQPKDSKTGQMMPPKGGSAISEADVKAVAAYVWSISRPRK